ncbi:MAG: extracellular solute-binding protein [Chloroflexi bacterium]|nr:extracellular solute-binding protein [Chloroflexota bacterium]
MRQRLLILGAAMALAFAACTGDGGGSPGPGETEPGGQTTAPQTPAGTAFDPSAISGEVTLGQWESSPAERDALTEALDAFAQAYPNVTVNQETIAGDYRAQMITRFGAQDAPDLFYVNAEYAPEWIREGFLEPLDDYIAAQGFDTSTFYEGYANIFKGEDGTTYGLPKDGNTIAMAYNTDLVPNPPATLDELVSLADSLKGQGDLKAPLCLSPGLDRGLAFLYAQGGSLLTDDNSASAIDSAESTAAVQWYLDLFKNGQGMAPGDMGDGWCGEALGKGDAAIVFEGGWLLGYMDTEFPDTPWAFAEMPTGSSGEKVTITYTAAYSIGVDSQNKDAAWVVLQYLTGPDGMGVWTQGGIAVPSRSDVPVPEGFDVIVAGADYARPGSGFMPGYNDVQKAFQDAMVAEITGGSYSADPVVSATADKINEVLNQ